MSFQENVRKLMEESGMNQKQLSKETGISKASLCRYLSGSLQPRIDIVENIARAFGVSVSDLVGDEIKIPQDSFDETYSVVTRNRNRLTDEQKAMIIKVLFGGDK